MFQLPSFAYSNSFSVIGDQVKRTDVCENSGKFLKCDSKSVLKIKDVVCMPNNYTCPEKDRIVSICEGQSSCESFGLRQQLWTYCQDQPRRTVVVDFSCESGIFIHLTEFVYKQSFNILSYILKFLLKYVNVENGFSPGEAYSQREKFQLSLYTLYITSTIT